MTRALSVIVAAVALLIAGGSALAAPEATETVPAEATGRSDWEARKKVVNDARRWLGTPYEYGTCTTERMNCTCLVKRAWNPNGHVLPLNEGDMWRYEPSRRVAKDGLKPGDIVFFRPQGTDRITHVGIYAGTSDFGGGKRHMLIDASSYYHRVVERPMSEKFDMGLRFHGAIRLDPR